MEEITTRFEIIRLAVNLGDFRTIDLQCERLRSLSLDEKLNEIIDLLESRNYRQALYEMKHYARNLEDEFFVSGSENEKPKSARTSPPETTKRPPQGLFDLGEAEEDEEEERVLNLDDILRLSEMGTDKSVEYRAAPEFEIGFEEPAPASEEEEPSSERVGAETVSDEEPLEPEAGTLEEEAERGEVAEMLSESESEDREERVLENGETEAEPKTGEVAVSRRETAAETVSGFHEAHERKASRRHPPISYISQKFRNMIHQFPPVDPEGPMPPEVEEMQGKISREGYTDEEIEEFLRRYQEYKAEGKRTEAAMVLLLAAATESQFAQFLLARELFRGEIIEEDHAEAFTQINTLADQNFAEAICDLGQFYEHGVGIGKDRQMALLLYEEAAEMGVARARKHYERLKNSRGILGVFKKVSLPKVSIPLPKKK
jgi:hypothetical protein